MVFLEKSEAKLLEAIIGQIQDFPSPVPPGEETELPSESIIGKVTDVKSKKDSKERFEIWFRRRDENWVQYGNTKDPKGYPVNLLIYDRK